VSTTIKWLVDNGIYVQEGDKLIELDDSGLQEEMKAQKILVDQARAAWVAAEANLKIVETENLRLIETERTKLRVAEINLEKYIGRVLNTEHGLSLLGTLGGPAACLTTGAALPGRPRPAGRALRRGAPAVEARRRGPADDGPLRPGDVGGEGRLVEADVAARLRDVGPVPGGPVAAPGGGPGAAQG
jgi:hypothetical protein